jgi:predicted nuclease with TOPRIM domain
MEYTGNHSSFVMSSLDTVKEMAEELEFKNQYYLDELEKMYNTRQELQTEINELNDAIDDLANENEQLAVEARDARRSFTALQISVSILLFAYGLFYGAYFGKCM